MSLLEGLFLVLFLTRTWLICAGSVALLILEGPRSSLPKQAIQEGLSRRLVVPSVVYEIAEPLGP